MRILLTNDDGISSPNLRSFHSALAAAGHTVHTVAPAVEQSGKSSALTALRPLFVSPVTEGDFTGFSVQGTPVDCALLGLAGLLGPDEKPDWVISGINRGPNAGMHVLMSGTVGAAVQGALAGIPSLAVSSADFAGDNREQARWAAEFLGSVDWTGLPSGLVYNLNFPRCPVPEAKGLKVCPQSVAWPALRRVREQKSPVGHAYWWLIEAFGIRDGGEPGTDVYWLDQGYMTLTPLRFDFTEYAALEKLRRLER
jgi:5'-nucleotidase